MNRKALLFYTRRTLSNFSGAAHFDPLLPKDQAARQAQLLRSIPGNFEAFRLGRPIPVWRSSPSEAEAFRLLSRGQISGSMDRIQSLAFEGLVPSSVEAAGSDRKDEPKREEIKLSVPVQVSEPVLKPVDDLDPDELLAELDGPDGPRKDAVNRRLGLMYRAKYLKYKNKYLAEKRKLK